MCGIWKALIVRREVFPTVPVSVEYSLTDKGLDFLDSLKEMEKWAENGEWNNPHDATTIVHIKTHFR